MSGGAAGARSSGSESSSSYIRKRDLPSQYSEISARPRYSQQRGGGVPTDQTPKGGSMCNMLWLIGMSAMVNQSMLILINFINCAYV